MELDEKTKLYKVRKTILQMLQDRGYIVSESLLHETLESFKEKDFTRSKLSMMVQNEEKENLFVMFYDNEESDKKVGVNEVQKFAENMFKNEVTRGIMIINKEITKKASQVQN